MTLANLILSPHINPSRHCDPQIKELQKIRDKEQRDERGGLDEHKRELSALLQGSVIGDYEALKADKEAHRRKNEAKMRQEEWTMLRQQLVYFAPQMKNRPMIWHWH